jgi:DNA repair exonuclease SbcCD nuclease subunit
VRLSSWLRASTAQRAETVIRFLHTGDWHLGMRRHFLTDESQPRYRQARLDAVRRMGEIAAAEKCAFMVVAGDVLDSNQVDPRTVALLLDVLRGVPVPVYLLPGNHDAADASSLLSGAAFSVARPAHVHVLAEAARLPVAPGVELVAAPWRTRRPLADLVRRACTGLEPGPLRIVLGHGAVDVLSPDAADPALIEVAAAESAIASGCIHYVALGDRHSVTEVGGTGRIWYAGTPEPTSPDEEGAGDVLVVALDRDTIEVERRRVGTWAFRRLRADFTADDDVATFAATLQSIPDKERTVLRLALTGTLTIQGNAALEAALATAADTFAGVTLSERRSDLAVMPAELDFAGLELAGFARAALDELRAGAEGRGAEAAASRDALALMVRLAGRA